MQGFIALALILGFVSPCLCTRMNVGTENAIYNVIQYGARGDGITDDLQAFVSAFSSACKAAGMSTLIIPAGKKYMVSKANFSGPCSARVLIQLEGQIVAPSRAASKSKLYWISVKYVNELTIDGNNKGGFHGGGRTWWQCPTCDRPKMLFFHSCNGLNVRNLRILNSPKSHVSVNMCNHSTFSHISINSAAASPNTDGFDISRSNNISIENSKIRSGDDCIAVNGGSFFINITRVTCGPGHGISIGSLGRNRLNDKVSDVHIRNCTFIGTTNGARIKTVPGGSGYARQITFEQIILSNVKNPIIIDQGYKISPTDTSVKVSSVTYRGFIGTSASKIAVNLNCSSPGCFNILLDQNNIVATQAGKKTSFFCRNAHGTVRNTFPNVSCLSS
ncbi:probable polygalacturonase At3g15720 [Medicago truncatula]|uniref:Polygalacturonase n=2 Tax=Medicago truncatula TaxID=3880 RepID=A0A072TMF5_MEDTR|nr:probable polygalacturonase At3g15720 [Medicago truncatula]KEH18033.1 polygalacturonase [Medicago truncatula]